MDLSYIINELGEDRAAYHNAVSPPIAQASNFSFDTIDDISKVFADEMSGYIYSRGLNPTVDILRKKLAALDGAEDALVFNNGAAATYAGVMANVKAGDHIVSVRNPYSWTQKLFDTILPRYGVHTTYVDGGTIEEWIAATQPNTTFYYLESPNSWTFTIQPLQAIAGYARQKGIVTLIDNSYATPLYQPVISLGIDIAMQTATKYIGGHSDTLGGVLCGSKAMMKKIFDMDYLAIGSGMQPFNAWLMLRSLRTMPVRLATITATTAKVAAFLKQQPQVESIVYPFDESFDQYSLAKAQMKPVGGLITIILQTREREKIVQFCEQLQHFLIAVSWGGHESLVLPKCAGIPAVDFDAGNKWHRSVRLYFGLEEAGYLMKDLSQALEQLT